MRSLQRTVLLFHLGLIAGLWFWAGLLAGSLLVLPLLAALPGLLRGRGYTAGWASMLVVFYVGGLLAEGVAAPQRRGPANAFSVIAVLDFVALMLFSRMAIRQRQALAARTTGSGGGAH